MFGDLTALTVPDVDRTDFFLCLGANPAASNGSLMSLGDVRGRLKGIRERGGRFVLVDPRRTETAAWADEHHFIRPGGDAALLLAMLHVLFAEGLFDAAAVARDGARASSALAGARGALPARAGGGRRSASRRPTIRGLARDFARAKRAVAYGRVGVCTERVRPGGELAHRGAQRRHRQLRSPRRRDVHPAGHRPRRRGAPRRRRPARAASARACAACPELGGHAAGRGDGRGDGDARRRARSARSSRSPATRCSRCPAASASRAALGELDFMVSIDFYLNETTRHAHPRHNPPPTFW